MKRLLILVAILLVASVSADISIVQNNDSPNRVINLERAATTFNNDTDTVNVTLCWQGYCNASYYLDKGEVMILHKNGTTHYYIASANTDIARGTALINAVSASASGDVIYLSANTFDVGTTQLMLPNSVSIAGAGMDNTVILSQVALTTEGVAIVTGDNAIVQDLTIRLNGGAIFQAGIGFNNATGDQVSTLTKVYRVTIIGDTDAFYFKNNPNSGKNTNYQIYESKTIAMYDSFNVVGSGAVGTTDYYEIHDTDLLVNDSSYTGLGGRALAFDGGTKSVVKMFGGSLTSVNQPSASIGLGMINGDTTSILYMYDTTINTTGTTQYDISIGSGKLFLNGVHFNSSKINLLGGAISYSEGTFSRLHNYPTLDISDSSFPALEFGADLWGNYWGKPMSLYWDKDNFWLDFIDTSLNQRFGARLSTLSADYVESAGDIVASGDVYENGVALSSQYLTSNAFRNVSRTNQSNTYTSTSGNQVFTSNNAGGGAVIVMNNSGDSGKVSYCVKVGGDGSYAGYMKFYNCSHGENSYIMAFDWRDNVLFGSSVSLGVSTGQVFGDYSTLQLNHYKPWTGTQGLMQQWKDFKLTMYNESYSNTEYMRAISTGTNTTVWLKTDTNFAKNVTIETVMNIKTSTLPSTAKDGDIRRNTSGLYLNNGTHWNCMVAQGGGNTCT